MLGAIAYEFPVSDKEEADDKIRKRLKRKKPGGFDPARVQLLRRLKDQVQIDIRCEVKGSKRNAKATFTLYKRMDSSDPIIGVWNFNWSPL